MSAFLAAGWQTERAPIVRTAAQQSDARFASAYA